MPSFKDTGIDQPIFQVVTPLIATRGGGEEICPGSAFLIGPGLAVTAHHVLAECLRQYDVDAPMEGSIDLPFQILAFLTLDGGKRRLPLRVMSAWRAAPLDIAVLGLGVPDDWPDDHRWTVPEIDLLPPKVGTSIAAVGFPGSRFSGRDAATGFPILNLEPKTAVGEVLEIHHQFRDQALLPFPCFRTNARIDGGMSGGPVLNLETGRVCGMVCSSMAAAEPEEEHSSHIASLWPLLMTPITAGPTGPTGAPPYPLMRLYETGVLRGDHLAQVSVQPDPDGRPTASVQYDSRQWDRSGAP